MAEELRNDERMVFAIGQTEGPPLLIMGITKRSYQFLMKGDNYQTFDFTRQGFPLHMLVIAGETRTHIIDRMSVYMPGPKIADMHSDNKIPESERAIPNMRKRAREFVIERNGLPTHPMAFYSDDTLDRLFKTILGVDD